MTLESNMSSSIEKLVPLLDGSNYRVWKDSMQSYLMSQGYWRIANGQYLKPHSVATTSDRYAQVESDRRDWDNRDDAAYGSIMLRIAPSLQNLATGQVGAKALWDVLAATLGKTGAALIYAEFKAATSVRISATNPMADCTKMATHFGWLEKNSQVIPPTIQAMILLSAFPRKFEHLQSTILSSYELVDLTFTAVRDHTVAEAQRKAVGSSRQPVLANKISAVKRKGANPNWQHSQQQAGGSKSPQPNPNADGKGKGKTTRGKRAGKQVAQKKQGHGHLASMATTDDHLEAHISDLALVTIVAGSGKIIQPTPIRVGAPLMVPNPLPIPVPTPSTRNP